MNQKKLLTILHKYLYQATPLDEDGDTYVIHDTTKIEIVEHHRYRETLDNHLDNDKTTHNYGIHQD